MIDDRLSPSGVLYAYAQHMEDLEAVLRHIDLLAANLPPAQREEFRSALRTASIAREILVEKADDEAMRQVLQGLQDFATAEQLKARKRLS